MPAPRSSPLARVLLGVIATAAFFALFSTAAAGTTYHVDKMAAVAEPADPIPGLVVTLSQVERASPPAFRATITNNNPRTVSLIDYDSPLDTISVALGHVELTASVPGAKPVHIDPIMVNRLWPPPMDAIVEIAGGGGSVSADIPISPQTVSYQDLGARFTVQVRGKWMAVFDRPKSEITREFLKDVPSTPDTYQGSYESDKIEMLIDMSVHELK